MSEVNSLINNKIDMKAILRISSAILLLFLGSSLGNLIPKKQGIQTLVLLDDWATLDTHSIFFDSLKRDGHNLVFEGATPPPQIKYFDDYFYDNIILMAPSAKGNNKIPSSTFRVENTNYAQRTHRILGGKSQLDDFC